MVRLFFFFERLLEELGRIIVAEALGEGASRAVRRDLVVLNALGSGDERSIEHIRITIGAENGTSFFDKAHHGVASFALALAAAMFKHGFQPLDVFLSLTEMVLERLFDARIV